LFEVGFVAFGEFGEAGGYVGEVMGVVGVRGRVVVACFVGGRGGRWGGRFRGGFGGAFVFLFEVGWCCAERAVGGEVGGGVDVGEGRRQARKWLAS